jgi:hypothetical protein
MKYSHFFDSAHSFFNQILGLSFDDDPELEKLYFHLRSILHHIMDHKEDQALKKVNVLNNIISKLDCDELDFLLPILEDHL